MEIAVVVITLVIICVSCGDDDKKDDLTKAAKRDGHGLAVPATESNNPDSKNFITIKGEKYVLQGFHWHFESEHTVEGNHHDGESHFVFKAVCALPDAATKCEELTPKVTNTLAVMGVFLDGDESTKDGLFSAVSNLMNKGGKEVKLDLQKQILEQDAGKGGRGFVGRSWSRMRGREVGDLLDNFLLDNFFHLGPRERGMLRDNLCDLFRKA